MLFAQDPEVFALQEIQRVRLQSRVSRLEILEDTSRRMSMIEQGVVKIEEDSFQVERPDCGPLPRKCWTGTAWSHEISSFETPKAAAMRCRSKGLGV